MLGNKRGQQTELSGICKDPECRACFHRLRQPVHTVQETTGYVLFILFFVNIMGFLFLLVILVLVMFVVITKTGIS